MTIKHKSNAIFPLVALLIASIGTVVSSGCAQNNAAQTETDKKSETSKLPKLKFHQPADSAKAVARLREIHENAMSDSPLLSPTQYRVKEVVHGDHSHYYRAKEGEEAGDHGHNENPFPEDDHGHEDDDGHETTAELFHDVEVPLFVEMNDIARWLPNIAAEGDFSESVWNEIKAKSKQLSETLEPILASGSTSDEQRTAYKEAGAEIDKQLKSLEEVIGN